MASVTREVLVVGDGNFSFSLALDTLLSRNERQVVEDLLGVSGNLRFTVTSFDTEGELLGKYPECTRILPILHKSNDFTVLHSINAWELEKHFPTRKFDVVLWNHPHLGTENFNLHRFLLCHFLSSAMQVLTPDGRVVVSVLKGQKSRWELIAQGEKVGLHAEHCRRFEPKAYPGYETRRNRTGNSFQNHHTQQHHQDELTSVTVRFRRGRPGDTAAEEEVREDGGRFEKKAPVKPHVCGTCNKGFTTKQGLQVHTRQVHELKKYGDWVPDRPKLLACERCDKMFPDDEALWQHCVARHTVDPDIPFPSEPTPGQTVEEYGFYPCPVCGMSVSRHPQWGMEAHLESLKPVIGLSLQCGVLGCTKTFIELRALRQHRNFCRIRQEEEKKGVFLLQKGLLVTAACCLIGATLSWAWRKRK